MLESIKKVDKKLIAMLGIMLGVILIIIIAIVVISLTSGGKLSFEKIEKKLVKAAESYCKDNEDKLPKIVGDEVKIESSDLVSGGYIKDLSEYTDEGVSCSAKVIVGKIPNGYDYVASLDCGNKYKTKFFSDKLKENVVTSGNGLYQLTTPTSDLGVDTDGNPLSTNELMSGYAYRGENVNNYILLGKEKFRIVKIDGNDDIMIVTTSTKQRGVYDDRYNTSTGKNSGINDYAMSRAHEKISTIYNELKEDSLIKTKGVNKNICIGPRSASDITKDGSSECKVVKKDQLYSLLPAYDILYASLSNDCKKTDDGSCENYNFLTINSAVWTMTPSDLDSHSAYKISSGLKVEKIERSETLKYVFYLSNRLIYVSGTGTESDPYIVK